VFKKEGYDDGYCELNILSDCQAKSVQFKIIYEKHRMIELYSVMCIDERYGTQFCTDTKNGNLLLYFRQKEAQYKIDDMYKNETKGRFVTKKVVVMDYGTKII
jgi:hypothetical protein